MPLLQLFSRRLDVYAENCLIPEIADFDKTISRSRSDYLRHINNATCCGVFSECFLEILFHRHSICRIAAKSAASFTTTHAAISVNCWWLCCGLEAMLVVVLSIFAWVINPDAGYSPGCKLYNFNEIFLRGRHGQNPYAFISKAACAFNINASGPQTDSLKRSDPHTFPFFLLM